MTIRERTGEAAGAPPEPPASRKDASAARTVLIIEDNVDAAETLREILLAWGHSVELAFDGRMGLDMARTLRPDVILCDIGLPRMDGYEVARAIRADPALSSAYLVAVTGYATSEDRGRAAAAGFDRHIAKPASIAAIEEALAVPAQPPT